MHNWCHQEQWFSGLISHLIAYMVYHALHRLNPLSADHLQRQFFGYIYNSVYYLVIACITYSSLLNQLRCLPFADMRYCYQMFVGIQNISFLVNLQSVTLCLINPHQSKRLVISTFQIIGMDFEPTLIYRDTLTNCKLGQLKCVIVINLQW